MSILCRKCGLYLCLGHKEPKTFGAIVQDGDGWLWVRMAEGPIMLEWARQDGLREHWWAIDSPTFIQEGISLPNAHERIIV